MDAFVGMIMLWPIAWAPRGWFFCQGQLLQIQQYQALYTLVGLTYGGDGRTTFGIPDLRSRVPVGVGQGTGLSAWTLGQTGGTENVTLLESQMPIHTHLLQAIGSQADTDNPTGHFIAQPIDSSSVTLSSFSQATTGQTPLNPGSVAQAGGGGAHTNIQPVLGLNYIICAQGLYPNRN